MLEAADALLDGAELVARERREREEAALADAVSEHEEELAGRVQDLFKHVSEASAELLPLVRACEPVPRALLDGLNAGIRAVESHHGRPCGGKSDVLPEPLLKAEPGSKLYPGLAKKLEVVCGRSLAELHSREVERLRARLLEGGLHGALDGRRGELASAASASMQQLFEKYAEGLSQSDHIPVRERVSVGSHDPIDICTWNVLEFPGLGASDPVCDGVRPVCDILLKGLRRKGAEQMGYLLEAVSSDVLVGRHTERVLSFVQDTLASGRPGAVLLLQEVGEDLRRGIAELCESKGWSAHFSSRNADASRCDAMTAVISSRAFDEVAELEVQRQKKVRHFAAARFGSLWIASVHLPLPAVPPEKERVELSGSQGCYELKVLQQLWSRFGGGGGGGTGGKTQVLAGGDWNAPLRSVMDIVRAFPPQGCESLELHAPPHETNLHDFLIDEPWSPIDGFVALA